MAVVRYRSSPWFADVTILLLLLVLLLLPLQQKMSRSRDEVEGEGSGCVYSPAQDTYGKVKDALLMYAPDWVVWP